MHSESSVAVKMANHGAHQQPDICARLFLYLICLTSLGLTIAAIVISATTLREKSLTVQICCVSSFNIGVIGSIFVSCTIYSILQIFISFLFSNEYFDSPSPFLLFFGDSHVLAYLDELSILLKTIEEMTKGDPGLPPLESGNNNNSGHESAIGGGLLKSGTINRDEEDSQQRNKIIIPNEYEDGSHGISCEDNKGDHSGIADVSSSAMKRHAAMHLSRETNAVGGGHEDSMMTRHEHEKSVQMGVKKVRPLTANPNSSDKTNLFEREKAKTAFGDDEESAQHYEDKPVKI